MLSLYLQLQKTLGPTSFEHMETITDLIKEYNLRAQPALGMERWVTKCYTISTPMHVSVFLHDDDDDDKYSQLIPCHWSYLS